MTWSYWDAMFAMLAHALSGLLVPDKTKTVSRWHESFRSRQSLKVPPGSANLKFLHAVTRISCTFEQQTTSWTLREMYGKANDGYPSTADGLSS